MIVSYDFSTIEECYTECSGKGFKLMYSEQ